VPAADAAAVPVDAQRPGQGEQLRGPVSERLVPAAEDAAVVPVDGQLPGPGGQLRGPAGERLALAVAPGAAGRQGAPRSLPPGEVPVEQSGAVALRGERWPQQEDAPVRR
jgi:hypothetical protein